MSRVCSTDPAEMLASGLVDGLFIGSPPWLHEEHINLAISSGLPVLCEKPLAHSLESAKRIAAAVSQTDIVVRLAFHLRVAPWFTEVAELLAQAALGSVRYVDAEWSFPLNPTSRNATWKLDPAKGGWGSISDSGVHAVDIVCALFGPPAHICAEVLSQGPNGTAEAVVALLRYSDFAANLRAFRDVSKPLNAFVITGTTSTLRCDFAFVEQPRCSIDIFGGDHRTIHLPASNPYADEIAAFVAACRGDYSGRLATCEDGLLAAVVSDRIRAAATRRRPA